MVKEVLVVDKLNKHYETLDGPVAAVKDVSFAALTDKMISSKKQTTKNTQSLPHKLISAGTQ